MCEGFVWIEGCGSSCVNVVSLKVFRYSTTFVVARIGIAFRRRMSLWTAGVSG